MNATDKRMPELMYLHEGEHGYPERQGHYQFIPPRCGHWVYVREDIYRAVVDELADLKSKTARLI